MEKDVHSGTTLLAAEFAQYREELPRLLRRMDWERLVEALGQLNQMAEGAGYREICLRSQSVIELLGRRGGGREGAGERVLDLVDSLVGSLAHIEWRETERIALGIPSAADHFSQWENASSHGTATR